MKEAMRAWKVIRIFSGWVLIMLTQVCTIGHYMLFCTCCGRWVAIAIVLHIDICFVFSKSSISSNPLSLTNHWWCEVFHPNIYLACSLSRDLQNFHCFFFPEVCSNRWGRSARVCYCPNAKIYIWWVSLW